MGWFWRSPSPPAAPSESKATPPSAAPPSFQPAKKPESGYSDPEIAKFMAQIHAEFGSSNSSSSKPVEPAEPSRPTPPPAPTPTHSQAVAAPSPTPESASSQETTWASLWGSSSQSDAPLPDSAHTSRANRSQDGQQQGPAPALDAVSESLLPSTMSCRQAFDAAFYCQSLGGQWNAIYRQGEVRSCSGLWDDYWFCMRTRTYGPAIKEEAIRDYYRRKELDKYGPGRPNSTDVWPAREDKVPPGTAFRERYEDPDISDEEWRMVMIERRRLIQEALAKEASRPS